MELENTDAKPAASSAVPNDPTTALANATPEAYATWQKTGSLPKVELVEDAEIDTAAPAAQATSTDAQPKAVSEPAKKDTGKGLKARSAELDAEIADLEAKLRRRHTLRQEVEAPVAPPADAKPAASSPATATDPEPDPDDATKYPDGIYDRKFVKDQAAWEARTVLRTEREADAQRIKAHRTAQAEHEKGKAWAGRITAAKAKYPDFEAKAFGPTEIREGSTIDVWVMESDLGAELLYHLNERPDEVRRIDALPVVHQLRELTRLEDKLTPAPAKTITDAPAPPRTLGDRTTTPVDGVKQAVRSKDTGSYIDEMNRRDMAARRG